MLGLAVLIIALPVTLILTLKKKGHTPPPNVPTPVPTVTPGLETSDTCSLTVS